MLFWCGERKCVFTCLRINKTAAALGKLGRAPLGPVVGYWLLSLCLLAQVGGDRNCFYNEVFRVTGCCLWVVWVGGGLL